MKKRNSKRRASKKVQRKQQLQSKKFSGVAKYADFLRIGIIILIGILIYSNSFMCSFQFDDLNNIAENGKIRNLFDIKTIWDHSPNRFISYFSFAVNYHLGEHNVWGYHLVDLIIHLLNTGLVYWLTLLMFSSPVLENQSISKDKKILAFFTALLFVSHPLATQSVTYIVQRMASMVSLFYLLSLSLYMKARLTKASKVTHLSKYLLYGGAIFSAIIALHTKENAFTLPLVIILFEVFFLQTKKVSINFKDYRIILFLTVFLGFLLLLLSNYTFNIFNPISPEGGINAETITPLNYLFTQFSVILKYIQLLFLPVSQNLDYDFPLSKSLFEIRTLIGLLLNLSIIILAIFLFKRNRIISFGIFWFYLTLSIESSFIPIRDVIFEHRTYLPSFGFFINLSSALYYLLWHKNKNLTMAIIALLVVAYSILTYQRNKVWENPITLWSDNILKSPDKGRPFVNRGQAYWLLKQRDNALADFDKAIEISKDYTDAYYNRGIVNDELGNTEKAITDYSKAISTNPDYAKANLNRGLIYGNQGNWGKAMEDYNTAIEKDSNYLLAYYNRAKRFTDLGQMNKAIADYSQVVRINPNYKLGFYNRGGVFGKLGQWDRAISDYDEAISIDPMYKEAVFNCGHAYYNLGKWEESIIKYSDAIQIDPNFTKALYNRSVAFVKLGQWDRAISDCTKVIGIDPGYAAAYHNRGYAYDNMNQLELAMADYTKTLELDPNNANARSSLQIALTKLGR